jgi:hypothetical protein
MPDQGRIQLRSRLATVASVAATASQCTYQAGDSLEQMTYVSRNELFVKSTLDLREFCDTELPSEHALGRYDTIELKTLYPLHQHYLCAAK